MTTTMTSDSPAQAGECSSTIVYRVVRRYRDHDNYYTSNPAEEDVYYASRADAELSAVQHNIRSGFRYDSYYKCFEYGVESVDLEIKPDSGATLDDAKRAHQEALAAQLDRNIKIEQDAAAKRQAKDDEERERIFREECERRGVEYVDA